MFFSVKTAVKIANKVFVPCVCYEANEVLTPTIEKLVAEGKAYSFKDRVYFQNGKVLEKKEESKHEEPKYEDKGKKERKEKKEKTLPTVAEDIPSPEEIADEGF